MLPAEIKRHRFTVEEYHDMAATGLLTEDDRVELIDGEIVEMSPIGWRHANCVTALTMFLARFALDRYVVSVQNPVTIGEYGELQPDLVLLEQTPHGRLPGPEDVALAIEVSDSTLSYDKNIKLPRYAQSGVPEVWIVDLENQRVEVHASPSPTGYRESKSFTQGQSVSSTSIRDLSMPMNDIFA